MTGGKIDKLSRGWVWVTIGEIAQKINPGFPSGRHNQDGRGVPHLRPMNISATGEINLSEVKFVEERDYDPLLQGDVLFNNTNSSALLGKTTYIRRDTNWAYSNHMTRIRLNRDIAYPAWVAYCLHHLFLTGFFRLHCRHHVNQASINRTFLSERVQLPLPPFPEQKRIVDEIEKQTTRLDAGIAALKRAQANLQRYKAAVLKAACEGRLVPTEAGLARAEGRAYEPASELLRRILAERRARWEAEHPGKRYKEPALPDTSELPKLPEGWVWATVEQVSEMMQYGTSEKADLDSSGVPVLRMGNVQDGRLDFSDLKYLPRNWPELDKFILQDGDVLFNRTNSAELVGKTAVYKSFHPMALFASYLIRVRTNRACHPDFLSYYINSHHGRSYVASVVSQQVGQANVSGTKLSGMPIPLPPLIEQHRIVAEVERGLSVIQELEAAVEANLKRAERLRQAILKRAFEGRLVPQDPRDEPAGVLLERIRSQKSKGPAIEEKPEGTQLQLNL